MGANTKEPVESNFQLLEVITQSLLNTVAEPIAIRVDNEQHYLDILRHLHGRRRRRRKSGRRESMLRMGLPPVGVNNFKPWSRGRRGSVRVWMTGISLGRSSRLLWRLAAVVRSGRGRRFLRARTPSLHVQWGPSALHLHKGRVGVLGPTPPTIKSMMWSGAVFSCVFFLSFFSPPRRLEREGIYREV